MNKQELKDWIKSANFYNFAEDEFDSNSNHFQTLIYEKDGKLYSIDYCNKEPCEVYGDKGYIRDTYQPKEVIRRTKMVEHVYYDPVNCEHKFTGKDLLCSKCGLYYPETTINND